MTPGKWPVIWVRQSLKEPRYCSASLHVNIPVQSNFFFATIVTIAVVRAIAGWTNDGNLTFVLNATVALRRTWYVCQNFRRNGAVEAAKHPTTITIFVTTTTAFVLPAAAGRN
jgi:hypothetical protein